MVMALDHVLHLDIHALATLPSLPSPAASVSRMELEANVSGQLCALEEMDPQHRPPQPPQQSPPHQYRHQHQYQQFVSEHNTDSECHAEQESQPAAADIILQADLFRLVNRRGEPLHLTSPGDIPLNARSKGSNSTRLWTDKGRLVEVLLPPCGGRGEHATGVGLRMPQELLGSWLVPPGREPAGWISLAHYTQSAQPGQHILDLARNRDLVAAFDTHVDGISDFRLIILARQHQRRVFYVSKETLSFRLGEVLCRPPTPFPKTLLPSLGSSRFPLLTWFSATLQLHYLHIYARHTYTHARTHAHAHTRTHPHIWTHTRTHTHTHTDNICLPMSAPCNTGQATLHSRTHAPNRGLNVEAIIVAQVAPPTPTPTQSP